MQNTVCLKGSSKRLLQAGFGVMNDYFQHKILVPFELFTNSLEFLTLSSCLRIFDT